MIHRDQLAFLVSIEIILCKTETKIFQFCTKIVEKTSHIRYHISFKGLHRGSKISLSIPKNKTKVICLLYNNVLPSGGNNLTPTPLLTKTDYYIN